MAKILSTNFGSMMAAMNHMIISEVKKALALLPGRSIETTDCVPLCRLVLSPSCDYEPRDVAAEKVYLDDDGYICIVDRNDKDEWTIEGDCDCLDITDFEYLISQIADKLDDDEEHDVRCTERQNVFYSPRKIGDEVEWINPEGKVCRTTINGILAEQEDQEPVEIIYTTNIMVGNQLRTAYLGEIAVLNKQ